MLPLVRSRAAERSDQVGLKTAAVRIFGCSEEFWENVIKPFHGDLDGGQLG